MKYEGPIRPGDFFAITSSEGQSKDYVIRILGAYPSWGKQGTVLREKGGGWIYEHIRFRHGGEILGELDVIPENILRRIYTPIDKEDL